MSTYQLLFDNNQLGNFNTTAFILNVSVPPNPPSLDQRLTVNSGHPADRLVTAGVIAGRDDVTGWRLTVMGDEEPGDNTVVPFAPIKVEYSTDDGATWRNYTLDINRPDLVFFARQDESDWMAITAWSLDKPDLQIGFIVANDPVHPGQKFLTDETIFEKQLGEYLIPCFAAETMIRTATGDMRVDQLVPGSLVWTADNGLRPVSWVGHRDLTAVDLDRAPHLRAIVISAGALGAGLPQADLRVSPQHRVLIRSQIAERMFGASEVLVAARHLLDVPGVRLDETTEVTYVHLLFDRHELVLTNGMLTESLFTGPEAMKAVGAAARREIAMLFPQILTPNHQPRPARPLTPGRRARRLVQRH